MFVGASPRLAWRAFSVSCAPPSLPGSVPFGPANVPGSHNHSALLALRACVDRPQILMTVTITNPSHPLTGSKTRKTAARLARLLRVQTADQNRSQSILDRNTQNRTADLGAGPRHTRTRTRTRTWPCNSAFDGVRRRRTRMRSAAHGGATTTLFGAVNGACVCGATFNGPMDGVRACSSSQSRCKRLVCNVNCATKQACNLSVSRASGVQGQVPALTGVPRAVSVYSRRHRPRLPTRHPSAHQTTSRLPPPPMSAASASHAHLHSAIRQDIYTHSSGVTKQQSIRLQLERSAHTIWWPAWWRCAVEERSSRRRRFRVAPGGVGARPPRSAPMSLRLCHTSACVFLHIHGALRII